MVFLIFNLVEDCETPESYIFRELNIYRTKEDFQARSWQFFRKTAFDTIKLIHFI